MAAALAILLLTGGFFVVHRFPPTAIAARRSEGQRLLLFSASAAAVLILAARVLIFFAYSLLPVGTAQLAYKAHGIAPTPFGGTLLLALVLAVLLGAAVNRPSWQEKSAVQAIYRDGDELEILLATAVTRIKPVEVSLETGKVYIGQPVETTRFGLPRRFVRLLPLLSGHRDSQQRLRITTSYLQLLEQVGDDTTQIEIVLPVERVVSARIYDLERPEWIFRPPIELERSVSLEVARIGGHGWQDYHGPS